METDIIPHDTPPEVGRAIASAFDKTPELARAQTCVYCGENAPDLVCPACDAEAAEKNRLLALKRDNEAVTARWQSFVDKIGPNYTDHDPKAVKDCVAARYVAEHFVGNYGVTLIGPGDTYKTRAAVQIARKHLEAGQWIEFRQCGALRQEAIGYARKGEHAAGMTPLLRCDFLILDDFANHEFTRTTEEFFLSLLEHRTNHRKPTALTSQYSTAQIAKLMTTAQMSDAICRRIGRQFATVINTADGTITRPIR